MRGNEKEIQVVSKTLGWDELEKKSYVRPIDCVLIEAADGSMGWHESKAAKRE